MQHETKGFQMSADFWRDHRVLVTGASGFLGKWMVGSLIDSGANVVGLSRSTESPEPFDPSRRISLVSGSVHDLSLMRRIVRENGIDTIFHLAAQPLVNESKRNPVSTFETNVRGTWTLLQAALESGVQQVVRASSVIGLSQHDRFSPEVQSIQEISPYGFSKLCAELISLVYSQNYGLIVSVLRCPNLFGGGDLNFSRVVPGVIRAAFEGRAFEIRSDGKSIRDYVYVEDAVQAFLDLARLLAQNTHLRGEVFHCRPGNLKSVLGMVSEILRLMSLPNLRPIVLDLSEGTGSEQSMKIQADRRIPGWSPRFSLKQGLRKTITWYRRASDAESTVHLSGAA